MQTIHGMESFTALVEEYKDAIILMAASWCAPCKALKPVFNAIEIEVNQTMAIADLDDNPELAGELRVRSVPMIVFIKDGKTVSRITGHQTEAKLLEEIEKVYG